MGQMTYALCYGVPDQEIEGFDLDDGGTFDAYAESKSVEIVDLAKRLNVPERTARQLIVPTWPCEANPPFWGFLIACGASGMGEVPTLEGFCLSNVEEVHAVKIEKAKLRWVEFERWCMDSGIVLPKPEIWLIEIEVA